MKREKYLGFSSVVYIDHFGTFVTIKFAITSINSLTFCGKDMHCRHLVLFVMRPGIVKMGSFSESVQMVSRVNGFFNVNVL